MLAQQNLTSPSASDENRRLRMLFNSRGMTLGKDGLPTPAGDTIPNVGSPLQAGGPHRDADMLIKVLVCLYPLSLSLLCVMFPVYIYFHMFIIGDNGTGIIT